MAEITVYTGEVEDCRAVGRQAEFVRSERVPNPLSPTGRCMDTIVVRLADGRLVRTDSDGYSIHSWCPDYAADRRYGTDGRDLGPAD